MIGVLAPGKLADIVAITAIRSQTFALRRSRFHEERWDRVLRLDAQR